MELIELTLGAFGTNCYIAYDSGTRECAVIDPADDFEAVRAVLDKNDLKCTAILLTHAHCDHMAALCELADYSHADVYVGELDKFAVSNPALNLSNSLFGCSISYNGELKNVHDGSRIKVGSFEFVVMETPGHTPGSVCYICENRVFCGDTVFLGGIGRTDFPGGNYASIMRSLVYVFSLDEDYILCPGHGASTTVSAEKRSNPYYHAALEAVENEK